MTPIWTELIVYKQLYSEPLDSWSNRWISELFHSFAIPRGFFIRTEDTVMPPGEWDGTRDCPAELGLYRLVRMSGAHELLFIEPAAPTDKILGLAAIDRRRRRRPPRSVLMRCTSAAALSVR